MKDDDVVKEAVEKFKTADQDTKNEMMKAIQKAAQKWLPNEAFKEHFEVGKKIAADRGDDELSMQFWIFGAPMSGYDKDKRTLVPVVFADWEPQDQEQKKMMLTGLGLKIAEEWPADTMLTTIVHVSEAWMVKRDKDDDIKGLRPSEQDDRIEVAIVHALSMDQRMSFWQGKILKDADGKFIGYEDILNEEFDPEKPKTIASKESFRDHLSEWILLGYSLGRQKGESPHDEKD